MTPPNAGKGMEKVDHLHIAGGNVKCMHGHSTKQFGNPLKKQIPQPCGYINNH